MSGVTDRTPKRECRFVGGPEDGVTFTMQGFAVTIGVGDPNGLYHAEMGAEGFDIDYYWRETTA